MTEYILNVTEHIAHRRSMLTENCNTDQIIKRRLSESLPKNYRLCEHCEAEAKRREAEATA